MIISLTNFLVYVLTLAFTTSNDAFRNSYESIVLYTAIMKIIIDCLYHYYFVVSIIKMNITHKNKSINLEKFCL